MSNKDPNAKVSLPSKPDNGPNMNATRPSKPGNGLNVNATRPSKLDNGPNANTGRPSKAVPATSGNAAPNINNGTEATLNPEAPDFVVGVAVDPGTGPTSTVRFSGDVDIWPAQLTGPEGPVTEQTDMENVVLPPEAKLFFEQQCQLFTAAKASLEKLAPKSPFVPSTIEEWLNHHYAVVVAHGERICSWYVNEVTASVNAVPGTSRNLMHVPNDGLARILAQPTVWCRNSHPEGRPAAPWPSAAAFQWEGDGRAETGVGRFLPLPRVQGNGTVAWFMLPRLPELEFDRVGRIPTAQDLESAANDNEQLSDSVINSTLWDAINEAGSK